MKYQVERELSQLTAEELLDIYDRSDIGSPVKTEIRAYILQRMQPCTRWHQDLYHNLLVQQAR